MPSRRAAGGIAELLRLLPAAEYVPSVLPPIDSWHAPIDTLVSGGWLPSDVAGGR